MSERLTAEPGTLSPLPEISGVIIGDEVIVVEDNFPIYISIVTIEELAADVLNWFDEDGLCVGSKSNPDHVAAWQRWNESMKGGETDEDTASQRPAVA